MSKTINTNGTGRVGATGRARAAEREARAVSKRLHVAAVESIQAADELRPTAAAWIAAIHSRLLTLLVEVEDVTRETRPRSVLAGVLSRAALLRLEAVLTEASQAAALVRVRGHDMPIPALLRMRDHFCEKLPHAAEFETLTASAE
jgi:hypothetical protein